MSLVWIQSSSEDGVYLKIDERGAVHASVGPDGRWTIHLREGAVRVGVALDHEAGTARAMVDAAMTYPEDVVIDLDEIEAALSLSIYADDRQTSAELEAGLKAKSDLIAYARELEARIKTGQLGGLLYTARTALHKATPNVSPEGAPVSDGWRVIWLCQHAEAMERELTKLRRA